MSIDISFCIITDNSMEACKRIIHMIQAIRRLEIENYEILVIGGKGNNFIGKNPDLTKIDFDESIKPGWITKKKNDVAKIAKYDNLVMMHDYFIVHHHWYKGYLKILDRFKDCDLCLNPVSLIDGRRDFTDWVTLDHPEFGMHRALPYGDESNIKHQYFSGGYFVVKKKFFLENPLSEDLATHEGEDVEWSQRIREKANVIFNPYSFVRHNKSHRNIRFDAWDMMVIP